MPMEHVRRRRRRRRGGGGGGGGGGGSVVMSAGAPRSQLQAEAIEAMRGLLAGPNETPPWATCCPCCSVASAPLAGLSLR